MRNIKTGEITIHDSLISIARATGVSDVTAALGVARKGINNYSGYAFRLKSDEPWPETKKSRNTKRRIITTKDGETVVHEGLMQCARYTDVNFNAIYLAIKANKPRKGFYFKYEE